MIQITDPRIESYLMTLIPEPDPQLAAMEKEAEKTGLPIIGRLCGRLLHLVTLLKRPSLVVELGSGFGYSAYWFARALPEGGKVVLIDYSEENISYARRIFSDAGLLERAEFRAGDALKIGSDYRDFDILFIDMDKYQYLDALKMMLPRLAANALVIADNALWHGTVAEEGAPDEDAATIRRFNEFVFGHKEFFSSIVPLRDGILLAYRRS